VVNLKTRDEAARRRARRKYVRIVMNDFLMNPGPSMAPIKNPQKADPTGAPSSATASATGSAGAGATGSASADGEEAPNVERFGLMASFVRRWIQRLPQALALGAGEHVQIPPGNAELITTLEPFERHQA
jgi:hypothetical protein